ncbi:DUF7507 domain-containing protein [Nocardia seriolae]|uniref:DUF7507 domain-containing protein n=1 Tax=Nocardia seriolae TaxID=37332 RepID=UPI0011603FF8|nr:hypothetical protein [Nocardia seriolae]QOW33101.1 hypothetical protein IMZ23_35465 [Nocardia seriolae]QUN14661.1 hypothetical protein KEC46_19380 [Nocardia seriolae]WNJ60709.1 hypothetical protein RMO66_08310 [Nocardia seriolae]
MRGKVLEIDVRPNTSGNSPKTPVTIDVYHTAGHTAEMIVGSAEMAEAGTIRLPANGVPPGSIRIQTHSKPDEGGQPESSQFSRTVPIVHEIADPSVQIEKRAWLDVPGDAPGFEDVLAEGTEIDTDSEVPAGTTIWWTYAVTNDGGVPLTRIAVEDDALGRQVCVIESLEPDATRGCTASGPVEAQP